MYLQSRTKQMNAMMVSLIPFLQTFIVCVVFLIGLTRISDHRHHTSDVAFGFFVGSTVGYLIVSSLHY